MDFANGKRRSSKSFLFYCSSGYEIVCNVLKTAELLSADKPKAVDKLYEYVRQNQEKVLLILDGYDEYSGGKSFRIH